MSLRETRDNFSSAGGEMTQMRLAFGDPRGIKMRDGKPQKGNPCFTLNKPI